MAGRHLPGRMCQQEAIPIFVAVHTCRTDRTMSHARSCCIVRNTPPHQRFESVRMSAAAIFGQYETLSANSPGFDKVREPLPTLGATQPGIHSDDGLQTRVVWPSDIWTADQNCQSQSVSQHSSWQNRRRASRSNCPFSEFGAGQFCGPEISNATQALPTMLFFRFRGGRRFEPFLPVRQADQAV